jgi:tetratricopeptide (TPR) repeat protein
MVFALILAGLSTACSSSKDPQQALEAEALFRQGYSYYKKQDWPRSYEYLDKALLLAPDDKRASVLREVVRFEGGNREESIKQLSEICGNIPEQQSCLVSLGHLHFKMSNWKKASETWGIAADNPKLSNRFLVYAYISAAEYKLENHKEAQLNWERSMSQAANQKDCSVRQLGSRVHLVQGNFQKALNEAKISLELCENRFQSYKWLAFVYYKTAQFEDAQRVLRKSLSVFRDPVSRSEAAISLEKLKNEEVLDEPELLL